MTRAATPESVSRRVQDAIGRRLDGSPLAVMLDVDGTISPIAPTPAEAIVPQPTREIVQRLTVLPGVVVAFVSGRSVEDTARMTAVAGTWLIGNHGFELRAPDGSVTISAEAQPFERPVAEAARRIEQDHAVRGMVVENKRFTISVHYRQVDPADAPALVTAAREVARALGLRVTDGKKVVELRPPVATDKGTAVVALATRLGALAPGASALYLGDDVTDEDAFRALRAADGRAVTVRVASSDAEAASTAAEFVLPGVDDVRELLEWVARRRIAAPAR